MPISTSEGTPRWSPVTAQSQEEYHSYSPGRYPFDDPPGKTHKIRHKVRLLPRAIACLVLVLAAIGGLARSAAAATPTFRQANANRITSGTTNNVTFAGAATTGDLIVVYVLWNNTGVVAMTDSSHNPYAAATPRTTWGSNWSAQTFYAGNVVGGTDTVTATLPPPSIPSASSWHMNMVVSTG
jgi:hypothetical protein